MRIAGDLIGIEGLDLGFEAVGNLLDLLRSIAQMTIDHAGHDQAGKRVNVLSVELGHQSPTSCNGANDIRDAGFLNPVQCYAPFLSQ
ncbi:hypothetical protein GOC80_13330 [Sinorhizobium medicae]|nr:hypothetical protein [Sinorhizobium medicae]